MADERAVVNRAEERVRSAEWGGERGVGEEGCGWSAVCRLKLIIRQLLLGGYFQGKQLAPIEGLAGWEATIPVTCQSRSSSN